MRCLDELKGAPEETLHLEVIALRHRWKLNWEYHDTIVDYIANNREKLDYSLGDKDIRIIDYAAQEMYPSDAPHDEFRVMKRMSPFSGGSVHIKLPGDLTRDDLLEFVRKNYKLISKSLDRNFPSRLKKQSPEQQPDIKSRIYLKHEQGMKDIEIADDENCDEAYVRSVVREARKRIRSE